MIEMRRCGRMEALLVGRAVYVVRWCFGSEAAVRPLKEEGRVSSEVEVASGSSRREVGTGQERSVGWDMLCFPKARRWGEGGGGSEAWALALGLVQMGQQRSTTRGPR